MKNSQILNVISAEQADALIHDALSRVPPASGYVIALSGGMDSMVLLHACIRKGLAPLSAIHVHHGLHPEAEAWASFSVREAGRCGVPCMRHNVLVEPTGQGLEAAARKARYRVFRTHLEPGQCLLMAHHQNDQLETLLLRFFKGARPEDLAGIPQERPLGAGRLYRPFLQLPRTVLEAWARYHDLPWVEDPSNRNTVFDRNFIRHDILPLLSKRWPDLNQRLTALQRRMRERFRLADRAVRDVLVAMQADTILPLEIWGQLSPGMQKQTLAYWLSEHAGQSVTESQLTEFMRQLLAGQAARLHLDRGMAARYRDGLYWVPASLLTARQDAMPLTLTPGQDTTLTLHAGRLVLRWVRQAAHLPAPAPAGLTVCGCRPEDRPSTLSSRGKSFRTRFQAWGVPPWLREYWPLICADDRVLALGDCWLGDPSPPESPGWRIHWQPDQAFFCRPKAQGSKSFSH